MAEHSGPSGWNDSSGFDEPNLFGDLDREPTPALLAAKAEPLSSGRPAGHKPPRSSQPNRPGRPPNGPRGPQGRAGGRRKPKPKEPSKLLLGLGVVAVLLSGFGAAYVFSQISKDDADAGQAADGAPDATTDTSLANDQTATPSSQLDETAAPASINPSVSFDEAALGPINADTEYTIAVVDGPADAQYQMLVDDQPQGEVGAALAPTAFTPGRHLLEIQITSPVGSPNPPPVVVYAVGPAPTETMWRANVSSVNVDTEGWTEAMGQFDAYVAAGHTELQLMPSDWFPVLTAGYWNLFVPGFSDKAGAVQYCEQHGLPVPDDCFPQVLDPDAPAGG